MPQRGEERNGKKREKVNPKGKKWTAHRKLEQISNIYFVFVVVHYLVHIFPSGFDKGTRRRKKKIRRTKNQAKKNTNQQKHIQSRFNSLTYVLHIQNSSEHPLNLACEINEPDNKSLHINFYRFDCGKIGCGKTTKSQPKKEVWEWEDFHIVQQLTIKCV